MNCQSSNSHTTSTYNWDQANHELVGKMVTHLNSQRRNLKHKRFYRNKLGEIASSQFLVQGILPENSIFSQTLQQNYNFSKNQAQVADFLRFEEIIDGSFMSPQDCFMKTWTDFLTQSKEAKFKLLNTQQFTHVSLSLRKTGLHNNVYQIGVLVWKASLTIDKLLERTHLQEFGCIIIGKVLESTQVPCFVVVNRGKPTQTILGPNRIFFDALSGDEFKIMLPQGFLGQNQNPFFADAQPTIEVYSTTAQNRNIKLGTHLIQSNNGNLLNQDVSQSCDPKHFQAQDQIELAFSTFMVPSYDYKNIGQLTFENAIQTQNLIQVLFPTVKKDGFQQPTQKIVQNQIATASKNVNTNLIGKTKSQLMREQLAKDRQQQQRKPVEVSMLSDTIQQMQISPGFPQQQRGNLNSTFGQPTFNQQPQNNFTSFVQATSPNASRKHFSFTKTTQNQFNQTQAPFVFNAQPQNPFQFNQQPNQPVQFNFQQPFQQQQVPNFQFQSKVIQQNFQVPQFTVPSKTIATVFNQPTQMSTFQVPQANQVQIPLFQFNQQLQLPQTSTQQNIVPQPSLRTPMPTRFNVQGTVSKQVIVPQLVSTTLQNQQPAPQQQQQQTKFQSLSSSDQQVLLKCFEEIAKFETQENIQRLQEYMMCEPELFYELYKKAHSDQQAALQQQVNSFQSRGQSDNQIKQQTDFSDIVLFLIDLKEEKFECTKYWDKKDETLDQVLQAKIDEKQALLKIVLSKELPRNDAFTALYQQVKQKNGDCQLILNSKTIYCHQVVMEQNSFLKDAMKENNRDNQKHCGKKLGSQNFYLPDWMDLKAVANLVKFYYKGTIEIKTSDASQYAYECIETLKVACYFESQQLQELIVAKEIIPTMTSSQALLLMRLVLMPDSKQKPVHEKPRIFLMDYCMFYISKNLPKILRSSQQSLLGFEPEVQYQICKNAFDYIVDAKNDLEIIINYMSEAFHDRKTFDFFNLLHSRIETCTGFDSQYISQITDIRDINHEVPQICDLLVGYDYGRLTKIQKSSRKSNLFDEGQQVETGDARQEILQKLEAEMNPSRNILQQIDGVANTKQISEEDATFTFDLNLLDETIRKSYEKSENGISYVSKAFNECRRSFHVKLDICKSDKSIGVWFVERGKPVQKAQNSSQNSQQIKFSSTLIEFEILDSGLKNRKGSIFFSFAHERNQVIGFQNFASLDQMANKDLIRVRIRMKEHNILSAFMQYLANSFQQKFKENVVAIESLSGRQQQDAIKNSLFQLPLASVYQLLDSDDLKVEDENTVLSFVFHYSKHYPSQVQTNSLSKNEMLAHSIKAANMLAKVLRYNFLSFYNVMSSIRKNEAIQLSEVFIDNITQELQERLKLGKVNVLCQSISSTHDNTNSQAAKLHFCGVRRNHYNVLKLDTQGRNKLLNSDKGIYQAIFEELIDWALKSNSEQQIVTQYSNPNQRADEIRYLNQKLYEDRFNLQQLAEENRKLREQLALRDRIVGPSQQGVAPVYRNQHRDFGNQNKENVNILPAKLNIQQKVGLNSFNSDLLNNTLNFSGFYDAVGDENQQQPQMNRPSVTNPVRQRQPPAGLQNLGNTGNTSRDLSAILAQVQQPRNGTRPTNWNYLNGQQKKNQTDCFIF